MPVERSASFAESALPLLTSKALSLPPFPLN
jgi:hypothetical protein